MVPIEDSADDLVKAWAVGDNRQQGGGAGRVNGRKGGWVHTQEKGGLECTRGRGW